MANRVLILENAYYSVISPEGCAAILWKDRTAAAKAAEALRITASTSGNRVVERAVLHCRTSVTEGKTLAEPLKTSGVFPTMVTQMISVGEQTGALDAMLWTTDGDELVVRAHHGPLPAAIGARQPIHGAVAGYAVRAARVVHVEDLTTADAFPVGRDIARRLGWRPSSR